MITSKQLKIANLIFAEHNKLLVENDLLYKQIENYKFDNNLLEEINLTKAQQIRNYEIAVIDYENRIEHLNRSIKRKDKINSGLKIISISAGIISLWLLLK